MRRGVPILAPFCLLIFIQKLANSKATVILADPLLFKTAPMEWFYGLLALVALEIVLGIDNVVFISILAGKLPPELRAKARTIGLSVALFTRIALLFSISWIMSLTAPLFTLPLSSHAVSGRDLILLFGGLFLIAKATYEIHGKIEGVEHGASTPAAGSAAFAVVIAQIVMVDLVFSLDSVITAVGMVKQLWVMVVAVLISTAVMMWSAGAVSAMIDRHPTLKMLALAFLVLIGANLLAEGFHQHIPKGYTYFAMAFSMGVEMLNMKLRARRQPSTQPPTPI